MKAHMSRQELKTDELLLGKSLLESASGVIPEARIITYNYELSLRDAYKKHTEFCIELLQSMKV